ncbi:MAG: hypothetical protein AB7L90_03455 [Hyphomicrobiaceae bacterium]
MSFKTTTVAAGLALAITAFAFPAAARDFVTREDGVTRVKAPTTRVRVDEVTGATRVKVRARASRVDVDTDRGHVRIRVPYYSGDIRW